MWWATKDSNLLRQMPTVLQTVPAPHLRRYSIFGQGGQSWTVDRGIQDPCVTVTLHQDIKNPDLLCLAGVSRFELDLVVLETTVQPLHYTPRLVIRVILLIKWLPKFVHNSSFIGLRRLVLLFSLRYRVHRQRTLGKKSYLHTSILLMFCQVQS